MTPILTSVQNPSVKAAAALHQKKHRQESGLVLVEGVHCIEEALRAGLSWETIFLRENVHIPLSLPLEPILVTEEVMAKIATTDSPPPVIGIARYKLSPQTPLNEIDTSCMLGLYALQDPGNVGTLVRAACAFGVTALVLIGHCADPTSPKVIRSSSGMVFRLPWYSYETFDSFLEATCLVSPIKIWAADAHGGEGYHRIQHYGDRSMLLLGSEAHGLPREIVEQVQPIHIPMAPQIESLNVAMAGAIILSQMWVTRNTAASSS